ncbi:MAG TPA: hypothetical protein PKD54_07500 [Pirellulaceae bacterium]|nr:hypothetical protein [Pirellulaceae bacterium]
MSRTPVQRNRVTWLALTFGCALGCFVFLWSDRTCLALQGEELGFLGTPQDAPSAEDRQQIIKFLVSEIDNLTPGDLGANAEHENLIRQAVSAFIDGSERDAMDWLERFRKVNAESPPIPLMLAAMYFAVGNAVDGMQHLEDAALVNPGLPTIYNAFARVAISQQRRTDALVLLDKSKQLIDAGSWSELQRQHFLTAYYDAHADLMILRRDFSNARRALSQLAQLKGDLPRVPLRLAEIAFELENLDEALVHLAEFRRMVPEAHVPEIMLATLFARRGAMQEAEVWLSRAQTKYVGDSRVALEYIDFMVNREKFDLANQSIAAVEKEFGVLPAVNLLKGKLAFAEERYAEAEALFAELYQSDPQNFEVANLLALALVESDRADKVAQALRQAQMNVQRQPNNAVACAILGLVYWKQGNLEQAGGWLNRAGQAGQLTPEVGFIFARFLSSRAEYDKALEILNGALQHQGLFLYRRAASALRDMLANQIQSESGRK